MFKKIALSLVTGIALTAGCAQAAVINGGSALLNQDNVEQLGNWLGQGVDLTNIYTKQSGNTSYDFHAAVDGKGATFTVMQLTNQYSGMTSMIGGYNPESWNNYSGWNLSSNTNDRSAFLFNLSTDSVFHQRTDQVTYSYYDGWSGYQTYTQDNGQYQTYNYSYYGPLFGGGNDLYVDHELNYAYSNLYSYASTSSTSLFGDNSYYYWGGMAISGFEVFTLAPERNDVPEPASLALFAIALGGLAAASRKRSS